MNRLIFVAVFLFLGYNLSAQEASPPLTPVIIANKLIDKNIDIETKDKLLDLAIDHKFKFSEEESEKVKKFIAQGLLSPYLSEKFKEKLIRCIDELEILLCHEDELISNNKIILNLSPPNRRKLVSEIWAQGLYDENYLQNLITLLNGDQIESGEKIIAMSEKNLYMPPLPAETLKKIRNDSKSYPELIEAVDKEHDKIWTSNFYEHEEDKLLNFLYNLVLQDEELLFKLNHDLENLGYGSEPWYSFYMVSTIATSDLQPEDDESDYDPRTELAGKRLEVFYKRNKTKEGYASNHEYNKAYLKSLLTEPGGVVMLNELMFIRPEKIYMFKVFFAEGQLMDVCELAKDVLNKYNKGKPFFWDYRDYIPYLEKLTPKEEKED